MRNYDLSHNMSLNQIAELVATDQELRFTIADNMKKYGGGFVKTLAECFYHADYNNSRRLTEAFIEYILEYQPNKFL